MTQLDNLASEVQENRDVTSSAVALLQGLRAKLDEAVSTGDMGRVQELVTQLDQNTQSLADAISANTPAA